MARPFALYDLLSPYFLAGFSFPSFVDTYLSALTVRDFRATADPDSMVYTGTVGFGSPDPANRPVHQDPNGLTVSWDDELFEFRLTVPRDGTQAIADVVALDNPVDFSELDDLFAAFGPPTATPTDYPGVGFRLELLVSTARFVLPETWRPAAFDGDRRVIVDPERASDAVAFVLPKIVLRYEQGDDLDQPPEFQVASWGHAGFDAPSDLAVGELVRMDPPFAVHESGRVAFGIDQTLIDLSPDHTPPEILEHFGTDQAFRGFLIKAARVSYVDEGKDWALNVGVEDVLYSFDGELTFEAEIDVLGPDTELDIELALYDGETRVDYQRGERDDSGGFPSYEGGQATIAATGVVHVQVKGGTPPFAVSVFIGDDTADRYDAATRAALISPDAPTSLADPGPTALFVTVTDFANERVEERATLHVKPAPTADRSGLPADRSADREPLPPATLTIIGTPPPPELGLGHTPEAFGTLERVTIGGPDGFVASVNGVAEPPGTRDLLVDVAPGQTVPIQVTFPTTSSASIGFHLFFNLARPRTTDNLDTYVQNTPSPPDPRFVGSRAPGQSGTGGAAALIAWLTGNSFSSVTIDSHASYEPSDPEPAAADQALSERRLEVAKRITTAALPSATITGTAHGHTVAEARDPQESLVSDRVAIVTGEVTTPETVIDATLSRPPRPDPPDPPPQPDPAKAPPAAAPNEAPPIFRRLSLRLRIERNVFVLGEVSGELDFETQAEAAMRNVALTPPSEPACIELRPPALDPTAPANPDDGVVRFALRLTHDPATHELTEVLQLGAHPDDRDGLLRWRRPGDDGACDTLIDVTGALLTFFPVLNAAAGAIDQDSAGDWVVVAGGAGAAATIGGLGLVKTSAITLYGGEIRARQFIPPGDFVFSSFGIIFDYRVDFGVEIAALGISTSKDLSVRYKAVGFELHFDSERTYRPIFDTSKGYEIDLGDPGLFNFPDPLDEILTVYGVRIARFNPLTLELDFGLKVDLGIVRVDRFKVKWPLDPLGFPSIMPSGIAVDIPGVLAGSGIVKVVEPPPGADPVIGGISGIKGQADVSLVPLSLRIAAGLAIEQIEDGDRTAVAFFAGLIVDFPTPIPLGQSGLGIFGFSGLFAMHYERLEPPADPTSAVSPALRWLVTAEGEPAKLFNSTGQELWGAALDKWSFGVGVAIGTAEGGFLASLRGMLVLELPGPRILIFAKVEVITPLEGLEPVSNLTVGILGVVDLDFNRNTFTIGVLVDLEVQEIVQLTVPTELFVALSNPTDWHLFLGTHQQPASARVLNLVRGYGYLMISGTDITNWPGRGPQPDRTLPAVAVATGIGASVELGSRSVGLYLEVAAGADLGVAFSPFFMTGLVYLNGSLHLFVVTIGAEGTLLVEAPDPTFINGEICGKVSFLFFSVKGCVGLSIGRSDRLLPAPDLVRNVWLQSHAPVLVVGQGGDRPIDASLGDAAREGVTELPTVSIDTIPVIQFHASPLVGGATTFTEPLPPSPLQTPGGWIDVGGGRQVQYQLESLSISARRSDGTAIADPFLPDEAPPAAWRHEPGASAGGATTTVDLAVMSTAPVHGEFAIERSTILDGLVRATWSDLCAPPAPPTCVLWTFCGQPIGPSDDGWDLEGTPWPDPPGTVRNGPPDTRLEVRERPTSPLGALADLLVSLGGHGRDPARVIGMGRGQTRPPDTKRCVDFRDRTKGQNPLTFKLGVLRVLDHRNQPVAATRSQRVGGVTALDVDHRTEIALSLTARQVTLTIAHGSATVSVVALDRRGKAVDKAAVEKQQRPTTVTLEAAEIVAIVIEAPQNEAILIELCLDGVGERITPPPFGRPTRPPTRPGRLRTRDTGTLRDRLRARAAEGLADAELGSFEVRLAEHFGVAPGELPPGELPPLLAERARPAATTSGSPRFECLRALQLPHRTGVRGFPDVALDDEAKKFLEERGEGEWVDLTIGPDSDVVLLLAVHAFTFRQVVVRLINEKGEVTSTRRFVDLANQQLDPTLSGLPDRWVDPAGPWRDDVLPVLAFLMSSRFDAYLKTLTSFRTDKDTVKVRIEITERPQERAAPFVVLGAVEVCSGAEAERFAEQEDIRTGRIETLTGYLDRYGDPVPLLVPDAEYTLEVSYTAIQRDGEGDKPAEGPFDRRVRFRTDARPPARLDAYVLATSPFDEEAAVFWQDAVSLVFNDLTVLQLYQAYGHRLRVIVRGADGAPLPEDEITELDPVDAELASPFWELVTGLVEAGLLPCTGSFDFPSHAVHSVPIELEPVMAYTLDVVLDPEPGGGSDLDPPLFRRQFSTSRFAGPADLAADIQLRGLTNDALGSSLVGLDGPADPDGATVHTDEAIEAALLAADSTVRGPADEPRTQLLWAPDASGTFRPHAILVDAAEPVWRERAAPRVEVLGGQSDPSYQRVVPGTEPALGLRGVAGIDRFVRSPSGTRTIAFLHPPDPGAEALAVDLQLVRHPSTLFSIAAASSTVLAHTIPLIPPWEVVDG